MRHDSVGWGVWNEAGQSEVPAIELIQKLGYAYVPPEVLEAERDSLREVVLVGRLAAATERLAESLDLGRQRAQGGARDHGRAGGQPIEANGTVYTTLTFGVALEQDRGDGRKGQQVRFVDFDHRPKRLLVTRQFRVRAPRSTSSPTWCAS